MIEYFIRIKEENGDDAVSISNERVVWSENLYVEQALNLTTTLLNNSDFYNLRGDTHREAKQRINFLKDVIENKGGWKIFYVNGKPITREADLQILYRLTWYATPSDVSREVDDGRGPADYKISRGNKDKTIVEFKLASNSQLKRNLQKQTEIYMKASDADKYLKVVIFFTEREQEKLTADLEELDMKGDTNIILIDARSDNKPSASKA